MTETPAFIPRASQLGAYFACDFRAGLDRQRAEGTLQYEIVDKPSPYAAFGTVTHYVLQTLLGCEFPVGSDCAPTDEEREAAAALFGGRREAMVAHAQAVAGLAADHMPSNEDGGWYAESAWETTGITGHIVFISRDLSTIVDLKTTQRKPDHNRIKPGHIFQLMAYRKLVATRTGTLPRTGYVLYADAKAAKWALLLPFDFMSPQALELSERVDKYIAYLQGPNLTEYATPRLGHHCAGDYCPYTPICRDKYIPGAGTPVVVGETTAPSVSEVF